MINPMPDAAAIWQDPYDMLVEWDLNPAKLTLEQTVANFAGDCGKLVDLGCGNGRLAKVLSYTSYQGYDGSFMMIADAKRRNPDLEFALIDIFKFQSDETYDTVLMLDVAIHQTDPIAAVQSILKNWRSKRYIVSLLIGKQYEELLNSVVNSYEELQQFLAQHPAKRILSETIPGEEFTWNLIEIVKEIK